jgi:sugar lactone lactonase YvrE
MNWITGNPGAQRHLDAIAQVGWVNMMAVLMGHAEVPDLSFGRAAQQPMSNHVRTGRRILLAAGVLVGGSALFAGIASAAVVPSITTVAGTGTKGDAGDGGPAVTAELNFPAGVTEDAVGTIYIADTGNNRVRKVAQPTTIHQDIISTIAGTGRSGFSGDEGMATSARLSAPSGLAVDSQGDVFIADTGNNRIRMVDTQGTITTFAGTGACGNRALLGNGGAATSASLCRPTGVALDHHSGDLLIADSGHNMVREVLTTGKIVAFAGTGRRGSAGDGQPAVSALLASPTGVATSAAGAVYIADNGNNKIRVVGTDGFIRTFAGTGKPGFSGDGGAASGAQLKSPTGLGMDPSGDVFITDTGNHRIRKVDTAHLISTYAGAGHPAFSGDGGPATAAQLKFPTGDLAADGSAVYFADTFNQRLRGIFTEPAPVLPESALAIALPLSAAVLIVGGWFVLRRVQRHKRVLA